MDRELSYLLKLTKARAHAIEERALMMSTASFTSVNEKGKKTFIGFPYNCTLHDTFVALIAPTLSIPSILAVRGALPGLEIVYKYGSGNENDYGSVDISETIIYPKGMYPPGETPYGGYKPSGMRIKIFSDTSWCAFQGTHDFHAKNQEWNSLSSIPDVRSSLQKWDTDLRVTSQIIAGGITLLSAPKVTCALVVDTRNV